MIALAVIIPAAGCGHPDKKPSVDLTFYQAPTVLPLTPLDGQAFTVSWRVFNADYFENREALNVAWTISRDGVAGFASGVIPSLRSRTFVDLSFIDTQTAGPHSYAFSIDQADATREANEANNTTGITVVVVPSPPPPSTTG